MTTCFFCQNLLSDYIEGILPAIKHEELKTHLDQCPSCRTVHSELQSTLELLHELPSIRLSPELRLKISQAATTTSRGLPGFWQRGHRTARAWISAGVATVILVALALSLPRLFPWLSAFSSTADLQQFIRYRPLANGASEIIEEQSSWLTSKGPGHTLRGSLWDEGGLSPQEFEKAFEQPQKAPSP